MGPVIENLYRADEVGEYEIRVSMLNEEQINKDAQILGVAYTKVN